MRKRLRFFKKWYVITGVIILVIILAYGLLHKSKPPAYETAQASIGNVIERVSVTGQVSPISKASLAFEKSGVIANINVAVGDHVKKGDVIASLDKAGDLAAVTSAEAKLGDLTRSLTPAESGAEQAKVTSAKVALTNAEQGAVNAARTGYIQAQGAILNYADTVFNSPQSANPTINIRTQSFTEQTSINAERVAMTDYLRRWKSSIDAATSSEEARTLIFQTGSLANSVKSYLSDLSTITNALTSENSGMTQAAIDQVLSNMNSALSASNQALSSITTAQSDLQDAASAYAEALSNYQLKLSGSSAQTIAAQMADVTAAKAELAKDDLISPLDGIVTQADPSVGEFAAAGASGFAVQSDGAFKIEAYIPEADIAKIAIGDISSTTLDAYGQDIDFPAQVTAIDPAETVIEGVPTYKVTLQFVHPDSRIRSGMTANLDILTHEHDGVITVPTRAILTNATGTSVRILSTNNHGYSIAPVTVGLKGSDGKTEIISGLVSGQTVVTYVPE